MYALNYGYEGWSMMHSLGGVVMMVIFWAVIIYFFIWLVRSNKINKVNNNDKSLDILKERYAKSEIGKEEFEEKKKDLIS